MENTKIAAIFQETGEILEIGGANRFKVNSYYRAAQVISSYPHDLDDIVRHDPKKLREIPSIGESLAKKIEEIVMTGDSNYHRELLLTFPKGLLNILQIRGLGPKKVKLLYEQLQIDSLAKLKKAAETHLIRELNGLGEKSETEILTAIEEHSRYNKRTLLSTALQTAGHYLIYLRKFKAVKRAESAGSLRRKKETIGDIDILVVGDDYAKIIKYFCDYPEVANIIAQGETKASVILKSGMQVDLRVLKENLFGAAWHYFTGSKEHNIIIRDRAKKRGLKISEYGVFKGKKMIGGKTEEEIFKAVDLEYIEPEMRENWGEIELAEKRKLPKLVDLQNLKGDLHLHSTWSDGSNSIEAMALAAQAFGLDYMAITDHSKRLGVTGGLDNKKIKEQWKEIDKINKKLKNFRILKGSEVDILDDGSLDFEDEILAELDIVVISIHSKFKLSEKEQTERVLKALSNPYVTIFGHPTARLINQREPVSLNMEAVISAAKKYNVAMEINANPHRLDLADNHIRLAREKGVKLVIDSDSHDTAGFANLNFGIYMARRGWLKEADVINTWPLEKLSTWLKK